MLSSTSLWYINFSVVYFKFYLAVPSFPDKILERLSFTSVFLFFEIFFIYPNFRTT